MGKISSREGSRVLKSSSVEHRIIDYRRNRFCTLPNILGVSPGLPQFLDTGEALVALTSRLNAATRTEFVAFQKAA